MSIQTRYLQTSMETKKADHNGLPFQSLVFKDYFTNPFTAIPFAVSTITLYTP